MVPPLSVLDLEPTSCLQGLHLHIGSLVVLRFDLVRSRNRLGLLTLSFTTLEVGPLENVNHCGCEVVLDCPGVINPHSTPYARPRRELVGKPSSFGDGEVSCPEISYVNPVFRQEIRF